MTITVQNYKQLRPSFDLSKLPKEAKEPFDLIDNDFDDYLELYTDSDPSFNDIRTGIDNHIKIVNKYLVDAPKKVERKLTAFSKSIFAEKYENVEKTDAKKDTDNFIAGNIDLFKYDSEKVTLDEIKTFEELTKVEKEGYVVVKPKKKPITQKEFQKKMVKAIDKKLETIKKPVAKKKPKFKVGDIVYLKEDYKNYKKGQELEVFLVGDKNIDVKCCGGKIQKGFTVFDLSILSKTKPTPKKADIKSTKAIVIDAKKPISKEAFKKKMVKVIDDKLKENKKESSSKPQPKPKYKVGDYLYSSSSSKKLGHEFLVKEVIIKDGNVFYKGGYYRGQRKENIILESLFSGKNEGKILTNPKTKNQKPKTKPKQKESPCDEAIENYLENKKEAREKASAKAKKNRIKNALDQENVNYYNAEFRLLRRFYNLVKKEKATFRSVQLLYMAFQKHSVARKIRKTSDLANLYEICNKKLTKIYDAIEPEENDAEIEFADKDVLEQLATLVANKKVDYAISLMNRVINIQGTAPEDKKVERLLASIENAFTKGRVDERSRLYDDLVKAKKELKRYLDDKVDKIATKQYGLSGVKKKVDAVANTKGLQGYQVDTVEIPAPFQTSTEKIEPEIVDIPVQYQEVKPSVIKAVKKDKNVLSTSDIMSLEFDTLPFEGKWHDFMQNPAKNMRLAIWGKPKNGKTAGALSFAYYLTQFGNVLYNFADQGINKSTQDLWKLSKLDQKSNAFLSDTRELKELDKLCASGNYDFVFIDMINTYINRTNMKPHEFEDQFLKKYPNISFILIFEVTKSGNFKGDQGWTHLPDALITVESFVMHNQGRYGVGEYVVWKEGLQKVNPKKYKEFFEDEPAEQEVVVEF